MYVYIIKRTLHDRRKIRNFSSALSFVISRFTKKYQEVRDKGLHWEKIELEIFLWLW